MQARAPDVFFPLTAAPLAYQGQPKGAHVIFFAEYAAGALVRAVLSLFFCFSPLFNRFFTFFHQPKKTVRKNWPNATQYKKENGYQRAQTASKRVLAVLTVRHHPPRRGTRAQSGGQSAEAARAAGKKEKNKGFGCFQLVPGRRPRVFRIIVASDRATASMHIIGPSGRIILRELCV